MIAFQSVSKQYTHGDARGAYALHDVSLDIAKGELVYLAGPSGAGKSTLMKMVAGVERPTSGQVIVSGHDIGRIKPAGLPFLRRNIGIIFQQQRLLNDRNILANTMLPMLVTGARTAEAEQRARAALDKVGLLDRAKAMPLELSGGEQQRVAVARALVADPLVLLADEPTGNLDPDVTLDIMEMFKAANARGTTIIMATHDRGLIWQFPRRVITLDGGRLASDERP